VSFGTCEDETDRARAGESRRVLVWSASGGAAPPAVATAAGDADVLPLRDLGLVGDRVRGRACVALVDVGPAPDGAPAATEVVETLTRSGVPVVGYATDADAWPLARRCRILLAGCRALLDGRSPSFPSALRQALCRAWDESTRHDRDERLARAIMSAVGAVGESRAIVDLFRQLARISRLSDLSTLITGETGTGKELLARALHAHDAKRRTGPFVALNCGAVTPSLAEAELFGHRRGAFTGADRDRRGLFRAAQGGVLFLDEIGEMAPAIQAKLLRVLQERRVLAVGEDAEVPVNVRVIAATNADLRQRVTDGRFRADLFHRLNVLSLHIPPLRERRDDIAPLVAHFGRRHRELSGGAEPEFRSDFIEAIGRLELAGNARQVENLVRGALVHNDGAGPIGLDDLPSEVWRQLAHEDASAGAATGEHIAPAAPGLPADPGAILAMHAWSLPRSLAACERELVAAALRAAEGNQSRAARLLGITPRSVYNKIRRHNIA
jgi:DNA-binding NtrC family response regulator